MTLSDETVLLPTLITVSSAVRTEDFLAFLSPLLGSRRGLLGLMERTRTDRSTVWICSAA